MSLLPEPSLGHVRERSFALLSETDGRGHLNLSLVQCHRLLRRGEL
jgi:hypothetical protein